VSVSSKLTLGLEFIKRLSLDEMIARESPVSKVATLMAVEDKLVPAIIYRHHQSSP
jgi:hypothetical protein